jgi:hypothetical protein
VEQETGAERASYVEPGRQVEVGKPGEWPHHFGTAEARFLDVYCGDLMRKLGYGKEPEWAALLERV